MRPRLAAGGGLGRTELVGRQGIVGQADRVVTFKMPGQVGLDRPVEGRGDVERFALGRLAQFCQQTGVRPLIDRVLPLADAADGFAAMIEGTHTGKIVFVP